MTSDSLRIALLGSRGIPARYGGYETFMEELSWRLAEAGHRVTVYCRSHYTRRDESPYRGVELVVLPTLRTKHLDTPVHSLLSALHVMGRTLRGRRFDAALMVNGANAVFVPLVRLAGVPTALHVDGIERRRAKWGPFGRFVYALSERLSDLVSNVLVTDAEVIRRHYEELYGADSWMIAYGAEITEPEPGADDADALARRGLEPGEYFLYVSRFEPENNPHRVVEAYAAVGGDRPLVMVGDAPYADDFIAGVRARADERVIFTGAVYGEGYRQLQRGALAYVHATEVGGTHPALLEGMGYGGAPLVNDTPENREVAGETALYFRAAEPSTLTAAFEAVRDDPEAARERGRQAARRVEQHYSWDAVTRRYVNLFRELAGARGLA